MGIEDSDDDDEGETEEEEMLSPSAFVPVAISDNESERGDEHGGVKFSRVAEVWFLASLRNLASILQYFGVHIANFSEFLALPNFARQNLKKKPAN